MEIIGHERAINFPIGCTLRLPSLQYYSYERYGDSQRRDCNGYEVPSRVGTNSWEQRYDYRRCKGRDVVQFAIASARL